MPANTHTFRNTPLIEPTWGRCFLAIIAATLLMTASSRIEVPMVPVPMTMQTFAALLIGGLLGARMATVAVTLWLLQGIAGLPLFSGGGGGIGHFVGPTGGYLVAFVLMAFMAGFYVDRTERPTVIGAFLVGMAGHAVCLGLGTAWLTLQIGLVGAFELGFAPFVVGSVVKSALVAIVFVAGTRYLAMFGHRI